MLSRVRTKRLFPGFEFYGSAGAVVLSAFLAIYYRQLDGVFYGALILFVISLSDFSRKLFLAKFLGNEDKGLPSHSVALMETDSNWVITKANPAATVFFGRHRKDLIGLKLNNLAVEGDIVHHNGFGVYMDESMVDTQLTVSMRRGASHDFIASVYLYRLDADKVDMGCSSNRYGVEIYDISGYQAELADQEILRATFQSKTIELKEANKDIETLNVKLQSSAADLQSKVDAATRYLQDSEAEAVQLKEEAILAKEESEKLRLHAETNAQKLQLMDEQKTDFFQNISHELRTPLTLIINPLENLLRYNPDDQFAQMAMKNSHRLLRLVNQLLEFQKAESDKSQLNFLAVDVIDFLKVCGDYFASACLTKKIDFRIKCDSEKAHHMWVFVDVDALEKIIFNYLSNAYKFTGHGGVIELGVESLGDRYKIYVRDNGVGIPKYEVDKLFNVFSQVSSSTQSGVEGTGLGLALVKSLAEDMSGEVGVHSELGKGSTFWVDFERLDMKRSEINILAVAEDEEFLNKLVMSLRTIDDSEQVVVHQAPSVEKAIEVMEASDLALVVSDTQVLNSNGLDLMQEVIKRRPNAYRFLITSESHFSLMERAINEKLINQVFHRTGNYDAFVGGLTEAVRHLIQQFNCTQSNDPIIDLLIVEDDNNISELIVKMLTKIYAAERIKVVSSINKGKDILSKFLVRCVLADYHLEDGDGLALLYEIVDSYPQTRRALMTGDPDIDIVQRALGEGAVEKIFYKPLDQVIMLEALELLIRESTVKDMVVKESPFKVKPWVLEIDETVSSVAETEQNVTEHNLSLVDKSVSHENHLGRAKELVLVVDDLADMRSIIVAALKKRNYRIAVATNGLDALEIAKEKSPDIVITDWMMPKMSGPELIKAMAEDASLVSTPTILLTAKNDDDSRIESVALGATAFLGKPFSEVELLSYVGNLLNLRYQERQLIRKQEAEIKIELVGNLAHRINNPMHHILSVQGILLKEIENIQSMLSGLLSEDDEARAIMKLFDTQFDSLKQHIAMTKGSIRRSHESLNEIYNLSGIEGVQLKLISIERLCDRMYKRLNESIGSDNTERININLNGLETQKVVGSYHVLLVVVEKVMKQIFTNFKSGIDLQISTTLFEEDQYIDLIIESRASFADCFQVEDTKIIRLLLEPCSVSFKIVNKEEQSLIVLSIPTDIGLISRTAA
ncbi:MAG: hypothetical protein CMP10_17390 [Zetaproteobacteria bacterium]|nr:hypothetical protein [Pseudobdellovibrionaceae bacterium]